MNKGPPDGQNLTDQIGAAFGGMGIGGDVLAQNAPKAFANAAGHLIGSLGESLSRRLVFAGVGVSVAKGFENPEDAGFAAFDGAVDVALSKFGLWGGVGSLAYDSLGGSKAVVKGQALLSMSQAYVAASQLCALGL